MQSGNNLQNLDYTLVANITSNRTPETLTINSDCSCGEYLHTSECTHFWIAFRTAMSNNTSTKFFYASGKYADIINYNIQESLKPRKSRQQNSSISLMTQTLAPSYIHQMVPQNTNLPKPVSIPPQAKTQNNNKKCINDSRSIVASATLLNGNSATAYESGYISIHDKQKREFRFSSFRLPDNPIIHLAINPITGYLAVFYKDKSIVEYDVTQEEKEKKGSFKITKQNDISPVICFTISKEGNFVCGYEGGRIEICDRKTLNCLSAVTTHAKEFPVQQTSSSEKDEGLLKRKAENEIEKSEHDRPNKKTKNDGFSLTLFNSGNNSKTDEPMDAPLFLVIDEKNTSPSPQKR